MSKDLTKDLTRYLTTDLARDWALGQRLKKTLPDNLMKFKTGPISLDLAVALLQRTTVN